MYCVSTGAFNAFDKDGDGIIKLNVLEVSHFWCFLQDDILSFYVEAIILMLVSKDLKLTCYLEETSFAISGK